MRNKQTAMQHPGPAQGDLRIVTRTTELFGPEYRVQEYIGGIGWSFYDSDICSTVDEATMSLVYIETCRRSDATPWQPITPEGV